MAKNEQHMEDLFREALASHEMDVSPKVWSAVQSALPAAGGAVSAGAVGGAGVLGKAAAVVGLAGLVTVATVNEVRLHTPTQELPAENIAAEPDPISASENAVWEEPVADQGVAEEGMVATSTTEPSTATAKHDREAEQADGSSSAHDMASVESPVAEDTEPMSQTDESTDQRTALGTPQKAKGAEPAEESSEDDEVGAADKADEGVAQATPSSEETAPKEIEKSTTAYFTHDAKQVITPNGDPYNEYLTIEGYGVQEFYIQIMTQSGQVVFESTDMNVRWNGQDRFGNALPNGVYFYEIQAVGTDGLPYIEKNAKGAVTVRR